jgi:hypothetical protein
MAMGTMEVAPRTPGAGGPVPDRPHLSGPPPDGMSYRPVSTWKGPRLPQLLAAKGTASCPHPDARPGLVGKGSGSRLPLPGRRGGGEALIPSSAMGGMGLLHHPQGEGPGPGDGGPLLVQREAAHTRGLPPLEAEGAECPRRIPHQTGPGPGDGGGGPGLWTGAHLHRLRRLVQRPAFHPHARPASPDVGERAEGQRPGAASPLLLPRGPLGQQTPVGSLQDGL